MKLVDELIRKVESATGIEIPVLLRRPLNAVWTLFQDLARCDLFKQASAMAYVTLLSLIPSLVAIFCVISLFTPLMAKGTSLIDELRAFILTNLASGSGESVVAYLDNMLAGLDLASIGWSSFASVLVTLVLLLRQIEEALNRIWLIRKGRNLFTRFMYFWTFLTLGLVVLAIVLGATAGFNIRQLLAVDGEAVTRSVPGWVLGMAGGFLFFFFLYKIVPNCNVGSRHAAVGAVIASFLLYVAGIFYGIFVKNASSYQTLYGALAQLPVFLMWLYICWVIILLGSLISWRMQEGFPTEHEEDTLEAVKTPVERLRNIQIKSSLPLLTLVAVYKNFQQGTGRGVSGQELARSLKLPISWIADALDVLGAMGYVIASKTTGDESDAPSVTDPYYPAYPSDQISLWRMNADMTGPGSEWMRNWQHELPLDLSRTLEVFSIPELTTRPDATLADALALLPMQQQPVKA